MRKEALDKIRFSRGQKVTLVRPKIGLLNRKATRFYPDALVSGSKNALKLPIFEVPKGQLLDTLLSYQGVSGFHAV